MKIHKLLYIIAAGLMLASCYPLTPKYLEHDGQMYIKRYNWNLIECGFAWEDSLKNSDPNTFHKINRKYSKDAKHVWFYDECLMGADPASFRRLKNNYSRDANHIWYKSQMLDGSIAQQFRKIGKSHSRTDSLVYFEDRLVKNADPDSFVELSRVFAKDKNRGYRYGLPIDIADPESFVPVLKGRWDNSWAKDRYFVYAFSLYSDWSSNNVIVIRTPIGDYETFKIEDTNRFYAKDKEQVYSQHHGLVKGADPGTFESIGISISDGYTKDKNHVFFERYMEDSIFIVEGADPSTFTQISKYRGDYKDSSHIYYEGKVIPGADPDTYEVLLHDFSRDKNHVYYRGKILEGADAATFIVINTKKGRDQYRSYEITR